MIGVQYLQLLPRSCWKFVVIFKNFSFLALVEDSITSKQKTSWKSNHIQMMHIKVTRFPFYNMKQPADPFILGPTWASSFFGEKGYSAPPADNPNICLSAEAPTCPRAYEESCSECWPAEFLPLTIIMKNCLVYCVL